MSGEQWAVSGERWAVGGGRWAVSGGRWAVSSGRWAVGSGQKAEGKKDFPFFICHCAALSLLPLGEFPGRNERLINEQMSD